MLVRGRILLSMVNILMALSCLLLFLEAFQFTFRFGLVNRTFYALSPSLIETCIVIPGLFNQSEEPYFDQAMLEQRTVKYLQDELKPHINSFTLSYYYYVPSSRLLCMSEYCQGVAIALRAPLVLAIEYQQTLTFEITKTQ